jgi:arylsulfatase A-like enzyme
VEEEAPPPDQPNILVILTDDQSYDSIPQTPAPMPYLQGRVLNPADHWARFSRAYLNTPLCCPSRASLLTGRYSHHHGVDDNSEGNKLDESSTLATWLDDAGYRTGLVGKYFNNYPWNRGNYTPPGWDDWAAVVGEIDLYYNYRINDNGTLTTYGTDPDDYSTDVLRDRALDFLDESSSDPFFLYFAPNAPHSPRTPAPRHAGLGTSFPNVRNPSFNEANVSDKPEWIRKLPLLNSNAIKKQDKFRRDSYLTLLAVDEAIAALIGEIEQQGKLDNTIIVFTTDNGFSYGEHRHQGKLCAHLRCSATPLFIRTPGTTSAAIPGLVSNVDIAPTLAELAGVVPASPVDGHSLVPLMTGAQTQVRQDVLIRWIGNRFVPQYWALRNATYTYVEYANGEVELYDLAGALGLADPDELVNKCPGLPAVCASGYNSVRNTLHARLEALKA